MKGLVIARDFFDSWGHLFLRSYSPDVAGRIAAGRILGSDVLGGDDEISRDHDWGPQFDLVLTTDDFTSQGEQISEAMNAPAPVSGSQPQR